MRYASSAVVFSRPPAKNCNSNKFQFHSSFLLLLPGDLILSRVCSLHLLQASQWTEHSYMYVKHLEDCFCCCLLENLLSLFPTLDFFSGLSGVCKSHRILREYNAAATINGHCNSRAKRINFKYICVMMLPVSRCVWTARGHSSHSVNCNWTYYSPLSSLYMQWREKKWTRLDFPVHPGGQSGGQWEKVWKSTTMDE